MSKLKVNFLFKTINKQQFLQGIYIYIQASWSQKQMLHNNKKKATTKSTQRLGEEFITHKISKAEYCGEKMQNKYD